MSPYRSLPVVAPSTRAVCVWCRHHVPPDWAGDVPRCNGRRQVVPCSVKGSKIVDDRRDCYSVQSIHDGQCPDFEPSIATRVLRWLGWRR